MLTHIMKSVLPNAKASVYYDFMVNPPPETYAHWLPEEHYEFHVVKHSVKTPVGDSYYFDQNIGKRHRMKFHALMRVADKPNRILFQMRKFGINLPGYLELHFYDTAEGLLLTETIRIGYNGFGKVIDPAIRLFYSKSFFIDMDRHHKKEWANLAEVLRGEAMVMKNEYQ